MNSTTFHRGDSSPRALMVTTVPITLSSFLLPLADALTQAGWQVDCLSAGQVPGNPVATSAEPALAASFVNRFDINWNRSPIYSTLRWPAIARRVREVVAQGGYDVVHVHTPIASFMTRMALSRLRARAEGAAPASAGAVSAGAPALSPRVIYTAHGFHFYRGQVSAEGPLYRALEAMAAPWTDDLVTINAEDYAAALELTEGHPCHVHLIEGVGLDIAAYDRSLSQVAAPTTAATVITSIGELNDNKRPELVIGAFALVEAVQAGPLHLFMVGDGPRRAELERLAADLGIAGSVTFTGQLPHDEVASLAALTDIGVLASEREGLPRSLMELVASGAAVVGTRTRGIADVVVDPSALADDPPSAESLARVIGRLVADPTARAQVAATQRAHALEHFDLRVILDEYLALYRA